MATEQSEAGAERVRCRAIEARRRMKQRIAPLVQGAEA